MTEMHSTVLLGLFYETTIKTIWFTPRNLASSYFLSLDALIKYKCVCLAGTRLEVQ